MPAILLDEEAASINMEEVKSEKKHKRSKEHKKRQREEDEAATPRRSKKSKKQQDDQPPADDEPAVKQDGPVNGDSKKKSKKQKKSKEFTNGENIKTEPDAEDQAGESTKASKKKHKKHPEAEPEADGAPTSPQDAEKLPKNRKKDKSRKEKKVEEDQQPEEEAQSSRKSKKKRKEREQAAGPDGDAMDIDDAQPTTTAATSAASSDSGFPFYTQTISLYVPFFPIGFDKPITNVVSQHLDPLLNHYSPVLRGVLLAYRNVNLSERPVRPNPKNLPDDHTPALLESLDEYAVGFGWLTADVDLFIPSRGAWMEGTVNLQSEGHIGVVCWNKFNASIEAKRLPAGWRWVDLNENGDGSSNNTNGKAKGTHTYLTADPDAPSADGEENEGTDILDDSPLELAELHTTGYWVDEAGERVSAKPLRFRIKNFDVGVAGDYGYISIEGTTLDDEQERAMARQEREIERRRKERQNPGGLLRPMLRRVPEFSLTSFGKEDQEEDSIKKTVLYQGSRPGTPDD
jgi:DNA-directed RNA polymerase I subunit RPA43